MGDGVASGVGVDVGWAEGDVPGVADGVADGSALAEGDGVGVTGVRVFRPVEVSMPSRAASAGL